jgi:hypothetical protein
MKPTLSTAKLEREIRRIEKRKCENGAAMVLWSQPHVTEDQRKRLIDVIIASRVVSRAINALDLPHVCEAQRAELRAIAQHPI